MKKLLAIICVLLVIFMGMYINKNKVNKEAIKISEVEQIEEYISKIYMWREVTKESLPKFDNINNAPELWIWEVVKNNIENYEMTYDEIQEKSKEIYGNNFTKKFPKEGTEYIVYEESNNKYYAAGIGLDKEEDLFLLNKIEKTTNGYTVELVEYIEDYSEAINLESVDTEYNIYIKNLEGRVISTIKNNENGTRAIEIVKQNLDEFTKKNVNLAKDESGNLFIESVK